MFIDVICCHCHTRFTLKPSEVAECKACGGSILTEDFGQEWVRHVPLSRCECGAEVTKQPGHSHWCLKGRT